MENIKPGQTITKTVYVANTGTLDANYNLVWQELTNEISNDEMVLEATCTRMNGQTEEVDGTCNGIESSPIGNNIINKNVSIEPNIVHKYDITIIFKEINAEQNYNQNKKFNGVIGIVESKENKNLPNSFSTDSWETIINAVKNNNVEKYNVGDTKEVNLGEYGTHVIRISNMSTPDECSADGFSQTACGFVLEFADIIVKYNMNTTNTNLGGWPDSALRNYLRNDIYNSLPSDLKSGIIDTYSVSGHGSGTTNDFEIVDNLYLLSTSEVWKGGSTTLSSDSARTKTRQLDYYIGTSVDNHSSASKMLGDTATQWWLRSARSSNGTNFFYVSAGGDWNNYQGSNSLYGISPAFRIG